MRYVYTSLLLAVACASPDRSAGVTASAGSAVRCGPRPPECVAVTLSQYRDDMYHRQIAYVCLAWLAACTPTPNPNPPPPNGGGGSFATGGSPATGGAVASGGSSAAPATSPEAVACANLAKLGCALGAASDCVAQLQTRCSNPKVKCAVACLATAASKTAIETACHQPCGGL